MPHVSPTPPAWGRLQRWGLCSLRTAWMLITRQCARRLQLYLAPGQGGHEGRAPWQLPQGTAGPSSAFRQSPSHSQLHHSPSGQKDSATGQPPAPSQGRHTSACLAEGTGETQLREAAPRPRNLQSRARRLRAPPPRALQPHNYRPCALQGPEPCRPTAAPRLATVITFPALLTRTQMALACTGTQIPSGPHGRQPTGQSPPSACPRCLLPSHSHPRQSSPSFTVNAPRPLCSFSARPN